MQPFDLSQAKNKKIKTKSGNDVRIICYDRKDSKFNGSLVALVANKSNTYERVVVYDKQGKQINFVPELDLVFDDE